MQQVGQTIQFAVGLLQQEVIALLSASCWGRKPTNFPNLKSLHKKGRLEKIHGMQLLHARMIISCGVPFLLVWWCCTVGLGLRTALVVQSQDCQNFCQNRLFLPACLTKVLSAACVPSICVCVFQTDTRCRMHVGFAVRIRLCASVLYKLREIQET